MAVNVVYEERDKQFPIKIELSLEEAKVLAEALNTVADGSSRGGCKDLATNLFITLREVCTYAEEDLPYE